MRAFIALCGFLLIGTQAFAQWGDQEMPEKPTFRERMFFGGGGSISFGTAFDYISISPLLGYKLTPKVATGLYLTYRYTNYKTYTPNVATTDYGVSPFIRLKVYGPFFLHTEYEYLNFEYPITSTETARASYSSFLGGGGFFQPVGNRAGLYASALYNFSYQANGYSPYTSPIIIRAGITVGF
jgi:hypothetical protein